MKIEKFQKKVEKLLGDTRKAIEKKSGKKIVSSQNAKQLENKNYKLDK